MKRLRPLVPGPPAPSTPCGRASTMWMTLSLRSLSPEVMKRLTPSMFQVPSSFGVALVRPAPTSEPASGSVSTIVVTQPLSTMWRAIFWSRSLPLRYSTPANIGPAPDIQIPRVGAGTIPPPAPPPDRGVGPEPHPAAGPLHRRRGGRAAELGEGGEPPVLRIHPGAVALLERL